MAWYNINSQDSVTAKTLEKIRTERCGFCGQEKPVRKRMRIYFSEFDKRLVDGLYISIIE